MSRVGPGAGIQRRSIPPRGKGSPASDVVPSDVGTDEASPASKFAGDRGVDKGPIGGWFYRLQLSRCALSFTRTAGLRATSARGFSALADLGPTKQRMPAAQDIAQAT